MTYNCSRQCIAPSNSELWIVCAFRKLKLFWHTGAVKKCSTIRLSSLVLGPFLWPLERDGSAVILALFL